MTHTDSPTCPLASCEIAHKSGSMAGKRHAAQAAQMAAFDGQRPRCTYGTGCRRTVVFRHIVRDFEGQAVEIRPVCALDAPYMVGGSLEPVNAAACVECGGISAHSSECTANDGPSYQETGHRSVRADQLVAGDLAYPAGDNPMTAARVTRVGPESYSGAYIRVVRETRPDVEPVAWPRRNADWRVIPADDSDLPYVAEGQDVFGALDEQYTAVDGFGTAAVAGSCGPDL